MPSFRIKDPQSCCFPLLYGIVLACGVALACGLGGFGFPCPCGDDAMYKSPAAELAQHGRLAVPCAVGFLPQADVTFACYPPLYQLLVGVWYTVFGVSLRSSLAYSYTVHLLGTAAVMEVARRLLPSQLPRTWVDVAIVGAVGLIQAANLSYFDRPEETALLWIWLEVLTAAGPRLRLARAAASGLWVGLAALTCPWVGMLGLLLVATRTLFSVVQDGDCPNFCVSKNGTVPFAAVDRSDCSNSTEIRTGPQDASERRSAAWFHAVFCTTIVVAVVCLLTAAWYVVMEALFPGAVREQFYATLHYLKDAQISGGWRDKLERFWGTLFYSPAQLPASALIACFFPAVVGRDGWRRMAPLGLALYATGMAGVAAVALVRPIAYTYLGAALMLMLPCLAPTVAHYCHSSRAWARLGLAALVLCTAIGWKDAVRLGVSAWRTPVAERPDRVQERLAATIPPGELVAVTALHWHFFQGRNPWREAYFSSLVNSEEVRRCQWLVLPPDLGTPDFLDAFEMVDDFPATESDGCNYGYTLWRRRGK